MPSVDLPAELASVGRARAFVAMHAVGRVADIDSAVLMVSELVTNVVLHTSSAIGLRVVFGPPFRVEVHDGHAATDAFRALIAEPPRLVPSSSIGGRGIGLVHALATRIGLDDEGSGGKVVWFEL
ncbi:ATP-binding protein [soil metagenome]